MKWHQPPTDNKWQPHEIPNDECLEFCLDALTHRGNCIDVGGHIGTMTRKLAENFNYVYSFEPLWHEYLTKNTNDLKNVKIYNVGLGNEKTKEKIYEIYNFTHFLNEFNKSFFLISFSLCCS